MKLINTINFLRLLVIFNKERFERIKGIVGDRDVKVVKERVVKKLSAKIEKTNLPKADSANKPYLPSNMVYTRNSDLWRLMRMNEWFKELAEYEVCAKKYLIKE